MNFVDLKGDVQGIFRHFDCFYKLWKAGKLYAAIVDVNADLKTGVKIQLGDDACHFHS